MDYTRVEYIYDSLCGWCYVALPEVEYLYQQLQGELTFKFMHRQLFSGDYIPVIDENFFKMIVQVGTVIGPQKTGQHFSRAYLNMVRRKGFRHESTLTARGAAVVNYLAPSEAFAFAVFLKRQIFEFGQDPNQELVVLAALSHVGINSEQAKQFLDSPQCIEMADKLSNEAQTMQQSMNEFGVPLLLLAHEGHSYKLDVYDASRSLEKIRSLIM